MLAEFTAWLWSLILQVFTAAWSFVQDAFISFFGLVVGGFAALVAAIPVPGWMSNGLGSLFGGLDSGVLYIVSQCGLPAALAVIGGGFAFRMARKFLTLFQW